MIDQFLDLLKTQRRPIIPYRPQANGQVERANKEILRHLKALVFDDRVAEHWSSWLPLIQRIVNATPHSSIGSSPSRVLFGDYSSLDRGILLPFEEGREDGMEDYVQKLITAQRSILEASQSHQQKLIDEVAEHNAELEDLITEFDKGDLVLISYTNRPPSKLHTVWEGPFAVVEKSYGNSYKCQDLSTLKVIQVDLSRMKPYLPDADLSNEDVAARDMIGHFVVEEIKDHVGSCRGDLKFLVVWSGYENPSWEPYANVKGLEALDRYIRSVSPRLNFLR